MKLGKATENDRIFGKRSRFSQKNRRSSTTLANPGQRVSDRAIAAAHVASTIVLYPSVTRLFRAPINPSLEKRMDLSRQPRDVLVSIADKFLPKKMSAEEKWRNLRALANLCETNKRLNAVVCHNGPFWKNLLERDYPYLKDWDYERVGLEARDAYILHLASDAGKLASILRIAMRNGNEKWERAMFVLFPVYRVYAEFLKGKMTFEGLLSEIAFGRDFEVLHDLSRSGRLKCEIERAANRANLFAIIAETQPSEDDSMLKTVYEAFDGWRKTDFDPGIRAARETGDRVAEYYLQGMRENSRS